jgi:hypothetical protein
MVILLFLSDMTLHQAQAITFGDGKLHILDMFIDDNVWVFDSPDGYPTTIKVVTGGTIIWGANVSGHSIVDIEGGYILQSLTGHGDSRIIVAGGTVISLALYERCHAVMTYGDIPWGINCYNNSYFTLKDEGTVNNNIKVYDEAQVEIKGGTIPDNIFAYGESKVWFIGEHLGGFYALGNSKTLISGGWIEQTIYSDNDSLIVILGSGFNYPYGYLMPASGSLQGSLADGNPLKNNFSRNGNSNIFLAKSNPADFDHSGMVNFDDFVILSNYWIATDCHTNNNCGGVDFETNGNVDFEDLRLFCENWLNTALP